MQNIFAKKGQEKRKLSKVLNKKIISNQKDKTASSGIGKKCLHIFLNTKTKNESIYKKTMGHTNSLNHKQCLESIFPDVFVFSIPLFCLQEQNILSNCSCPVPPRIWMQKG